MCLHSAIVSNFSGSVIHTCKPSAVLLKFACWQESSLTKGGCILSLERIGYALAQARPRRHVKGTDSLVPRLSPARDVDV